jgi:hypothetical protein
MSNEADSEGDSIVEDRRGGRLPTVPCSVVWSRGHAYVLEAAHGLVRWVGRDDQGRPLTLTHADLERRGWSRTLAR